MCRQIIFFFFVFLCLSPLESSGQNRETKKMIIVSYHSFTPLLSSFIEFKNKDNIDCFTISIDSGSTFQHIKQKIDSVYSFFSADFLLLVGDHQHIPSYRVDEGLSDIHYTFADKNTDTPRMAVGRFSVENEQDLHTIIERNIHRKPSSFHVAGIASQEISELTLKYDYQQIRTMGNAFVEKGFSILSELFDGSQGGGDKDNNPTYKDIIATLNSGTTWVNYAGYGSYDGWNTGSFESTHLDSLNPNIELPIIVSASCLNGHFADRSCFAEKWIRHTKNGKPVGAIAVFMPSSFADWDATLSAMITIGNNIPNIDGNCRLGDLYLIGYNHIIHEMQRKKDAYCLILFGDPSMWIYAKESNFPVEEKEINHSLFAFPNPALSSLALLREGNLFIYTMEGKLVKNQYVSPMQKINLTDISSGMYVLILYRDNRKFIQKLIIK
ncbi:MAG: C25 family cysteine peptidase [Bacteroidales bacterium]|nr:C25 family cysteine peptidase [Bacteroidales bacterium]